MAKSKIKGIMGHQGSYNPMGVDPAMLKTLRGEDDSTTTPRKPPKMTKVEKDYIKGTGGRPSAKAAVDKVRSRRTK